MLLRFAAPSTLAELRERLLSPQTAAGILPRRETVRALAWGGGLGVLGVMTGYAAFVAWVAEAKAPEDWRVLLAMLLIVAVIAAIGEQARHIITQGAHAAERRGLLARTASILAGFAIVLLFEISNSAWHKGGEKLQETLEDMLGLAHEPLERKVRLAWIIVVWIASGALVATVLVRRILSMQPGPAPTGLAPFVQAWRDGWKRLAATALEWLWKNHTLRAGGLAALAAAGICAALLVAAVIAIDGLYAIYLLLADYGTWQSKLRGRMDAGDLVGVLSHPALALDIVLGSAFARSWFLQGWLLLAYGSAMLWRFSRTRAVIMLLILAIVVLPPVATGWFELPRLSLVYALLWFIPAFVLGAISPYLREFRPAQWGRIACLVALALLLLAMLQVAFAWREPPQGEMAWQGLLAMTLAAVGLTVLIGLILAFAPPTREYLPLTAVVCGLLSYAAAGLLVFPTYIVERVVFLGSPAAKPQHRLCSGEAMGETVAAKAGADKEPQSQTKDKQSGSGKKPKENKKEACVEVDTLAPSRAPFVLPWKARDWEIGERFGEPSALLSQLGDWNIAKEVLEGVKEIASLERDHARWQRTHELRFYLGHLREPQFNSLFHGYLAARVNVSSSILFQDKRVARLYQKPILPGEASTPLGRTLDRVCPPNLSGEACVAWKALGRRKRGLCPGGSRIECLAALANPAKALEARHVGWSLPDLKNWVGRVGDALEADLRSRWVDQAIGFKLHAALSGAIGFFLALAALIAWQIRNAHEGVGRGPGGPTH
jgi:hypothetical protein